MKNEIDGVGSAGMAGGSSLAEAMVPGPNPAEGEGLDKERKRKKRKLAKLRSVWISFTGRIVAQFVGSAASIVLGLTLIHNYKTPAQGPEKISVAGESVIYQGRVARLQDAGGHARPSVVVLPIDDYSQSATGDAFARALTECVTASLAERGSLVVLSRTSASHVGTPQRGVPAIARQLAVDLVLEASVTRSGDRIRVVAQLIDGRSDEHLWAGRYDRESVEPLGLQAEIADQIARDIDAALSGSGARPARTMARLQQD